VAALEISLHFLIQKLRFSGLLIAGGLEQHTVLNEGLRQVGVIKLELLSQRGCAIKTYGGTQGVNVEGGAACVSCAHDSQDVRTSTHEGSGADIAAGAAADPSLLRLSFFECTIADWACCDKERFFLTLPFFFGGMALLVAWQAS
jgi:hypothetical protein